MWLCVCPWAHLHARCYFMCLCAVLCLCSSTFRPIYGAFHRRNFANSNYACLEILHFYHCLHCCGALLWIVVYLINLDIFFGGGVVHTDIANTITNILITNIIIQIPDDNYLTWGLLFLPLFLCLSTKSSNLSRVQEAKTCSLAHSGWRALVSGAGSETSI